MNEIRNELLTILNMQKNGEDNRKFYLELLLERFQFDIEKQLEDIKYKQQELESNLETLKYIRKELGIKEK